MIDVIARQIHELDVAQILDHRCELVAADALGVRPATFCACQLTRYAPSVSLLASTGVVVLSVTSRRSRLRSSLADSSVAA
jgi:hypothetical protein